MKRARDAPQELSFEALVSPDFDELTRRFPDFGRAYKDVKQSQSTRGGSFASNMTQDFSIQLTKALLHVHWALSLTNLPLNQLCPPVPNRFFYVNWLQQQVLLSNSRHFHYSRSFNQRGLDIGTGAACIYPLLFCATNMNYQLYATDIEPESVELARQNVQSNHHSLATRIQVVHVPVPPTTGIFTQVGGGVGPLRQSLQCLPVSDRLLDFCMTNPPFFDTSTNEQTQRTRRDGRERTAMTVSEGSYPGGEVAFVMDMILDGLELYKGSAAPIWSSCMCGKKASWQYLLGVLQKLLGPSHVLTTEFGPGDTTRWFLAWTFEQPQIKSPNAWTSHWSVSVVVEKNTNANTNTNAARDVALGRIEEFLAEKGFVADAINTGSTSTVNRGRISFVLPVSIQHTGQLSSNRSDLPSSMQAVVATLDPSKRLQLLPPQGSALLDVTLEEQDGGESFNVHVQAYCHCIASKKSVETIKLQMQGEICRTNRRWRRKQKQTMMDTGF
jgi:23S rRNA A1618 N6-methylase RlmF